MRITRYIMKYISIIYLFDMLYANIFFINLVKLILFWLRTKKNDLYFRTDGVGYIGREKTGRCKLLYIVVHASTLELKTFVFVQKKRDFPVHIPWVISSFFWYRVQSSRNLQPFSMWFCCSLYNKRFWCSILKLESSILLCFHFMRLDQKWKVLIWSEAPKTGKLSLATFSSDNEGIQ